ncbi:MAG: acyl-CoA reductase [Sphingobacteriales bacterium]|nr:MAG: acyl-CoA reductase [Sphingobacteriales bacterium]TAF81550.1 MAG: acyl-CoA reductase [Sphingobacteriales bacterium]
MSDFSKEDKIMAFSLLGDFLRKPNAAFNQVIHSAQNYNAWFTPAEVSKAVAALGNMLNHTDLQNWLATYPENSKVNTIGLVLAGNLPLVGLHDVLCVLSTGNKAVIKPSSQDNQLLIAVLNQLFYIEPRFKAMVKIVLKLDNFDAIIATGSNNTSRYFEYYFGRVPHIIRKARNAVAVLTGNETCHELQLLGEDIFSYYGLGCRNVSKLFVPKGYDFNFFFESIESYNPIINHHKYHNNYDYNKSIYLVNKTPHLDNGFLLLSPNEALCSPLAVLYHQSYNNLADIEKQIMANQNSLQVIVSHANLNTPVAAVNFGESQKPKINDYADGVNTLQFLASLG